jgi:hypothetical protein
VNKSEYLRKWREENPEKVAAGKARSLARRKQRWDEFLKIERERYAADPSKKAEAQRKRIENDPNGRKAIVRRSYEKNQHKFIARVAKRKAAKLQATPAWADMQKIERFYLEARRLTEETGVLHEVDHIYPLQGKTVCGLHVHTNLRVVTRADNRAKGAKIVESLPTQWLAA